MGFSSIRSRKSLLHHKKNSKNKKNIKRNKDDYDFNDKDHTQDETILI